MRFYRDYSIADFIASVCFTIIAAYGAFRSSTRTGVCEELSRQPELMRDLGDMGLSLENCERWFERAVMAFAAISVIICVARVSPNSSNFQLINPHHVLVSCTSCWLCRTTTNTFTATHIHALRRSTLPMRTPTLAPEIQFSGYMYFPRACHRQTTKMCRYMHRFHCTSCRQRRPTT